VKSVSELIADVFQTGSGGKYPVRVAVVPTASPTTPIVSPACTQLEPARETLSRFERLYLAITVASLVISALGFTAVVVSIRTAQQHLSYTAAQTRVLTRDRSLSNVVTLDKVFLDHPELRPYFYDGKDLDESHPLYSTVETVADMHLDVYGYNLDYRLVFPDDYRSAAAYKRYVRDRLSRSPVMRRRLAAKGEWFSPYLQELYR
jgi:hypothetical protein